MDRPAPRKRIAPPDDSRPWWRSRRAWAWRLGTVLLLGGILGTIGQVHEAFVWRDLRERGEAIDARVSEQRSQEESRGRGHRKADVRRRIHYAFLRPATPLSGRRLDLWLRTAHATRRPLVEDLVTEWEDRLCTGIPDPGSSPQQQWAVGSHHRLWVDGASWRLDGEQPGVAHWTIVLLMGGGGIWLLRSWWRTRARDGRTGSSMQAEG